METWYKVSRHYGIDITPIEVLRTTDNFLIIPATVHFREHRVAKSNDFDVFLPTELEAVNWLISRVKGEIARYELSLKAENERLEALRTLHGRILNERSWMATEFPTWHAKFVKINKGGA
jgi:hypothetical protein